MGESSTSAIKRIEAAIADLEREREGRDDGKWLEYLTVDVAPLIREWDVKRAWLYADWPQREALGYPKADLGIDVVAERHDARLAAIQCKSRAPGGSISADEIASFFMASANREHWAERWLVVNLDASPNRNALSQMKQVPDHPIKPDSLHQRLVLERDSRKESESVAAESAQPRSPQEGQTKDSMQAQVIEKCVDSLRKLQDEDKDGSPRGEARGRLILPCGTGKTRISLRIVERLATSRGDVSMVLCPSIALVAQIRGEYIRNHDGHVNGLAVCSDQAAGDPVKNEERHAASPNPTDDSGLVSASAVKGQVTTDPSEIANWLRQATDSNDLNVIFGTYQSAHQVASALKEAGKRLQVLVCDEAHRTAGIKIPKQGADADALKNFTICHDSERFPANFRLYQTATPRIYDDESKRRAKEKNLHIRDMDDQATFGPELDRRSYQEAVKNNWLSDYKIIAIAVNDHETMQQANKLANSVKKAKGKKPKLGVTDYQKGLAFALAMAQEIHDEGGGHSDVSVKSCIAFLNTIANSKAMRDALTDPSTLEWLNKRLDRDSPNRKFVKYAMEHLDASSSLTLRDEAKAKLARGTEEYPHSVLNVGIFGEGTDSPSLSAVAFLEPRKSQVDVVQAVGRVMRTAPGKSVGYIIVPIHVPQDTPAEEWLMSSSPDEGWRELGQILRALRAHDGRIERDLPSKLKLVLPPEPDTVHTLMAVKTPEAERATKFLHTGRASDANEVAEALAKGEAKPESTQVTPIRGVADLDKTNIEPARIVTAKVHNGDSVPDVRVNTVSPKITDRVTTRPPAPDWTWLAGSAARPCRRRCR